MYSKFNVGKFFLIAVFIFWGAFLATSTINAGCGCGTPGPSTCSGPGLCRQYSPNSACSGGGNNSYCDCSCYDAGGGNWQCGCGGWSPPPACSPSSPGGTILNSPTNNSIITTNNVTFSYSASGGWGVGCPANNNYYRVQIDDFCNGNFVNTTNPSNNLQWGVEYCWRVVRSNGSLGTFSAVSRFTVAQPPIIDSVNIDAAILSCGFGNYIGRSDIPGTNNPVDLLINITDAESNFALGTNRLDSITVLAIPSSVQNANNISYSSVATNYSDYGLFRIENIEPGNLSIGKGNSSLNNYDGYIGAGDVSNQNSSVRILGVNSNSTLTRISNNSVQLRLRMEFLPTFNSDNVNFYVSVQSDVAGGVLVSNDPNSLSSSQLVMTKSLDTWTVDNQAPSVNISDPIAQGASRFSINWDASDSSGLSSLESICYVDGSSTISITDLSLGQVISLPNSFPASPNCLVTTPGSRSYQYDILNQTVINDLVFTATATDMACNISIDSGSLVDPFPWVLSSGASIAANGGFNGFDVRVVSPAVLTSISPLIAGNYLTTYLATSDSGNIINTNISQQGYAERNYNDRSTIPASSGATSNWYNEGQYMIRDKVSDSFAELYLSGSTADSLGVSAGSRNYISISGDLFIDEGTICNTKTMFVVGGVLEVDPNFINSENNRCIFFVQGDITILSGQYSSASQVFGDNSLYDRVEGAFFSNGSFNTLVDLPASGEVADGLIVEGTVVSSSIELRRDLGIAVNLSHPAEVFIYDATIKEIFRDDLSVRSFSLRAE